MGQTSPITNTNITAANIFRIIFLLKLFLN